MAPLLFAFLTAYCTSMVGLWLGLLCGWPTINHVLLVSAIAGAVGYALY